MATKSFAIRVTFLMQVDRYGHLPRIGSHAQRGKGRRLPRMGAHSGREHTINGEYTGDIQAMETYRAKVKLGLPDT